MPASGSLLFLTAYRDFRDNYMVEILEGLQYSYDDNQTIITRAETLVAFGVILAMGLLNFFRDNRTGLIAAFSVMTGGVILLGGDALLLEMGTISGFWWLTLTGLGSYLAYVPYGSLLFDRMIATTKIAGTAVFAIYVADAIGCTGVSRHSALQGFGSRRDVSSGVFPGLHLVYDFFGCLLPGGKLFLFSR